MEFDLVCQDVSYDSYPAPRLAPRSTAQVNAVDEEGATPLHAACYAHAPNKVIADLLERKADVNAVMAPPEGKPRPGEVPPLRSGWQRCTAIFDRGLPDAFQKDKRERVSFIQK